MKKILTIFISAFLFIACDNKKDEPKIKGSETDKQLTFETVKVTDPLKKLENYQKNVGTKAATNTNATTDENDVPSDLVGREFLTNTVGFKGNLEKLVGMVVKKTNINNKLIYTVITSYKLPTAVLTSQIPKDGKFIEKKYDSKASAEVKYLFASVNGDANRAVSLLINDVSESIIDDNQIDMAKLFNRFENDQQIAQYYFVKAAVLTSILTKEYTKMSAKGGYNTGAIKVNSEYYNENSNLTQDWKIGVNLVEVSEYVKEYRANRPTPPSQATTTTTAETNEGTTE